MNPVIIKSVYEWKIDPIDRSWYITPEGKLLSDLSHRLILKKEFALEWDKLKDTGITEGDIDNILENRLIQIGYIKIGELENFYSIFSILDDRSKELISSFCNLLLNIRKDTSEKLFVLNIDLLSLPIKSTVSDISNGYLFTLNEESESAVSELTFIQNEFSKLSDLFQQLCEPYLKKTKNENQKQKNN